MGIQTRLGSTLAGGLVMGLAWITPAGAWNRNSERPVPVLLTLELEMNPTTTPPSQRHRLRDIQQEPQTDGTVAVTLQTDLGPIRGRYHPSAHGDAAVLWVFGAGGGLGGPAGGVYYRLGRQLAAEGIASLELDYRRPADLAPCVLDVQFGLQFLARQGKTRIVLVGHSFGGAVVITAGAQAAVVIGVVAISSQLYGTDWVDRLSPRPLLLLHGTADEVLPAWYSQELYERAQEPKQRRLYPGCRHGLDQCREALEQDLRDWIRAVVGPAG